VGQLGEEEGRDHRRDQPKLQDSCGHRPEFPQIASAVSGADDKNGGGGAHENRKERCDHHFNSVRCSILTSGLLPPSEAGTFRDILKRMLKLRDRTLPWAFILGVVLALTGSSPGTVNLPEMGWARDACGPGGCGN